MILHTSDDLARFMENARDKGLKERFIAKQLHEYIESDNDAKVMSLYGLRRTGKTVMMLQQIRQLNSYENTLLIECEKGDTLYNIRQAISEHPACKYIFIDEITRASEFIGACSFLADEYAVSGKKVVLSGTDSLGFLFAQSEELYDRTHLLHTTYIPYAEYKYLLGRDLMSYIEYGGTLTDGEMFYNSDRLRVYSNTAIVFNIENSLKNLRQGRSSGYMLLHDIIEQGELPTAVNKVLELDNRRFLASIINKDFHSHDLGSLAELMTKHGEDISKINTDDMSERIRAFLSIKKYPLYQLTEEQTETLIEFLKAADVLYQIPDTNEYIFTQTGMRYCQATEMVQALLTSDELSECSESQKYDITKKLKEDICGRILENIVFHSIAVNLSDDCRIKKYSSINGKEIDAVISNLASKTSTLIEVKLSDKQSKEQVKHLTDNEFCNEIEKKTGTKIINRVVIYSGTSGNNDGIVYLGAEQFLCNTEQYTKQFETISLLGQQKKKPRTTQQNTRKR